MNISFTREGWHGRMRDCRGVEASMKDDVLKMWDEEYRQMLLNCAKEKFEISHYISIAELICKK